MSNEGRLCDLMGYRRAILFPSARAALGAWCKINKEKIKIPSNCCSALLPFSSEIVPVNPTTGLAPIPVQLYGYRQEFPGARIEIDPLMSGLFGEPFAESSVISFGYSKTIDLNGGGAILTQDVPLAEQLEKMALFPPILRGPLDNALNNIHAIIMEKKIRYEEIENLVHDCVRLLPSRPIIPWRFVGMAFWNGALAEIKNKFGLKVSRNYPPLPGIINTDATEWGQKVINIWK